MPINVTPMENPYLNNNGNANENIRYMDRTFEGDEIHNEMIIELAIKELKKLIPQATYELYQSYMKKLREIKANATVIAYLQQATIQTATATTNQVLVEEKPISSQALGTLITKK
eukprot:6571175-Ditylum_brightwellii.AAC.1